VYYAALLGGSERALAARLGDRATIYDPVLGAASGLAAIQEHLGKLVRWLRDARGSYVHRHEVIGVGRDVTEGLLSLGPADGPAVELPVACVMQRKKERQADLRVYHATLPLGRWQAPRAVRRAEDDYVLASDVAEHLAALRLGDADALVASFESEGHLRDGAGRVHPREGGHGTLRQFYVATLQNERGANDWVPIVRATADDGRSCAVEYTTERLRGGETAPKEGLIVFERGDSGLFRSVRIYDELGLPGVGIR